MNNLAFAIPDIPVTMTTLITHISLIRSLIPFSDHHGAKKVAYFDVSTTTLRLFRCFTIFLVTASAFTTTWQLFGSPIHCHVDKKETITRDFVNSLCWVEGVFTIVTDFESPEFGAIAHKHGFPQDDRPDGGILPPNYPHEGFYRKRQRYYQWVSSVLFNQGVFFFLPYRFWRKQAQDKIMRIVVKDIFDEKLPCFRPATVAFKFMQKRPANMFIFIKYLCCLLLGLAVIVSQAFLLNTLLSGGVGFGDYYKFGLSAVNFLPMYSAPGSNVTVNDALRFLFPILSKCTIKYYAVTGDVQSIDSLCILPINEINAKVYLVFWFGIFLLLIWMGLALVGYVTLFVCVDLRVLLLKRRLPHGSRDKRFVYKITHKLSLPDWFVLNILAGNITEDFFKEIAAMLDKSEEELKELVALDEKEEKKEEEEKKRRQMKLKEAKEIIDKKNAEEKILQISIAK